MLTSPEQTATGKDMTNPPPWRLPFLVAVEELMIVAEQGFKDYEYSDVSIYQRVKVLSRFQRYVEVKAKQEKDMSEYSSRKDTSCAWKKIEKLEVKQVNIKLGEDC
ncbi:hypothetical protein Tco_0537505 [Tanacetum coccineum]